MSYTHLHFHTDYSLLDGANKIKNVAKKIKELGMSSVAITDHGNMFGAIDFYQTMKREGIKPIIGMEAYVTNYEFGVKEKGVFHLCLYAKDKVGYQNLMYLSSKAYENMYYKPRITKEMLKERSEGLICTSACLAGEVNFHLNQSEKNIERGSKGYEEAKKVALEYKEIFGEDFYLEIMRHGIEHQFNIDNDLIKLSRETEIPLVATNDTHYTNAEDSEAHEVYMAIGTAKTWDDPKRMRHTVHEFFIKSPTDMEKIFLDIPEAVENTNVIADKCNLELDLGDPTPPNFKFTLEYSKDINLELPQKEERFSFENDSVLFAEQSRRGLEERLKFVSEEEHQKYRDRLEHEINIINNLKFPGYMLIVWDFVRYSGENNIPVGPGRGSAAGSLVAFALRITDIDPMKYDLLFERFLNPERVSMPDIDMDFAQNKRKEIIHYVQEKYGRENVAQVTTFSSLLPKGVIRDVSRVFDVPLPIVNDFVKLIPDELKITLAKAKEKEPRITETLENNLELKKVWEISEKLEGLKRNTGIHAAGLVISNEALWNKTPLHISKEGDFVTQYSLDYLEDVDLIKFDFLGLKTLDVVFGAVDLVKKHKKRDIVWQNIDMNDPKVYEMMSAGKTIGMFQIESGGMQDLNRRMKPSNFEDVIALIALYRPGPMEAGMLDEFVERKHGRKDIFYPFEGKEFPEQLKEILDPTYGMIVYQEQVMQIVQKIGGFSLGKSDIVRRAMGKKKIDLMKEYKSEFANGAEEQGLNREIAEELFDLIEKFAGYGFNKSHSAAYAMITFQTAYLKSHYPAEFMASLLSTESSNMDKIALYVEEVKTMGIQILSPDINMSQKGFSVIKKGKKESILFGIEGIKGLGEGAVEAIVKAQKDGDFKDIPDFLNRVRPKKPPIESLIKAGAFDKTQYNRKTLLDNIDKIIEFTSEVGKLQKKALDGLFGDDDDFSENTKELPIVPREEYKLKEKLELEKEVLNFYVSAHPLDEYREEISKFKNLSQTIDKDEFKNWQKVFLVGFVEFEEKISNAGNLYGRGKVSDFTGELEFMIFGKELMSLKKLDLSKPILLKASVKTEDEKFKLENKEFFSIDDAIQKFSESKFEKYEEEISKFKKVSRIIDNVNFKHEQEIVFVGFVNIGEEKISKAGNPYSIGEIEDISGEVSLILFESEIEILKEMDLSKPIGMKTLIKLEGSEIKFYSKKFFTLDEVGGKIKNLKKGKIREEIKSKIENDEPSTEKVEIYKTYLNLKYFLNKSEMILLRKMAKELNGNFKLMISFWHENIQFLVETDLYVSSDFGERFLNRIGKS
jgi:DNA polymerase-3 subunit alpha